MVSPATDQERAEFRAAVYGRKPVHPFTTGRWFALGWIGPGDGSAFVMSIPQARPLTAEGVAVLRRSPPGGGTP